MNLNVLEKNLEKISESEKEFKKLNAALTNLNKAHVNENMQLWMFLKIPVSAAFIFFVLYMVFGIGIH